MILSLLLAILFVIAMLGGAIRFARRRSRGPSSSSDQSRRILLPAFAFALGASVFSFLAMLGWAGLSFQISTTITVLVVNGGGSLLLISATDVAAMAMGARRTRAWLVAGMAVFAGGAALALLISAGAFTGHGFAVLLAPNFAALIALAVAAALIWWSFLPAAPRVAAVFE